VLLGAARLTGRKPRRASNLLSLSSSRT
jgi:hypothetical protein